MLKYRGPSDTPHEHVTSYEIERRIEDLKVRTRKSFNHELEEAVRNYHPTLFKKFFNNDRELLIEYLLEAQMIGQQVDAIRTQALLSSTYADGDYPPANNGDELIYAIRRLVVERAPQFNITESVAGLLVDSTKPKSVISSVSDFDRYVMDEESRYNSGINKLMSAKSIDEVEELVSSHVEDYDDYVNRVPI